VSRAHKIANLIGVPMPLIGLVLAIALLEKLGVVWNVVRVSPERQAAKTLARTPDAAPQRG
jgi:hypothetical protein